MPCARAPWTTRSAEARPTRRLGFKIVADPSTPLLAAFAARPKVYAHLVDGFGIKHEGAPDWGPTEEAMPSAIDLEKLLAVERATVEKGHT